MRCNLTYGLVACGLVLLGVACSKESEPRAPLGDTIAGTDSSGQMAGPIKATVEYREIRCESVASRGPVTLEVGAAGDTLGNGPDTLVIAPGVVPQGEIYTFRMSRNGTGEIELTGTPKSGGVANFQEPTNRGDPKFILKVDYSDCGSTLPGMALAQDRKVVVLPFEIQPYRSVTAELEHLSTYAVAAPGYTSRQHTLRMAPAPVRGVEPDTIRGDTATADSSAH